MTSPADHLGQFGIFRRGSFLTPELATVIESLGFGTIWVGGSPEAELRIVEDLLDATSTVVVATGIVNLWTAAAPAVAASYHRIEAKHPGRFLLGVGVGHPEAQGTRYRKPYEAVVEYLDELDAANVPKANRVLAALGPKMLKLSADRSAGAHPYLTSPDHTRRARELIGPGVLLAPEHKVVLQADPVAARAVGRPAVEKPYLGLVNYTNNLRTLGYTDADLAGSGSDRLIDALVAHGNPDEVAAALTAHLDAGADHVAINLLVGPDDDLVAGYTTLAETLFSARK
jgi:probable F420-dependent oxidoreductase